MRSLRLTLALLCLLGASLAADTYPRQPIDLEHYRFALTLSDTTDRIDGEATIRLKALKAGVTSVWLDLAAATPERNGKGMTVQSVTSGEQALPFTHAADRVTITLPQPSRENQRVEFVVRYAGIPADGLQIKPNPHGDRTFFSDNWPNRARQWLPTIDHISDKSTMEMAVTAPAHYQVVSNGRRIEETDLPGGRRRTVWLESAPIAPWLYALGVAPFAVQHVGDYKGIPIETWVFAQDRDAGFHDFAVPTRDALAFYSERIGPYAYEKLANVQSNSVSGGMEAASANFYSSSSVVGDRNTRWRNVVIHEIAHQWFGNAVTERDWDDVWLSEGFATYFTLLFIEHAYGRDEFADGLRRSRQTVLAFYEKTPDYRIVHDNLDDMSKVTTGMTYQKGSWVLHMLRQRIGDDRFWAGIRTYYKRYMNSHACTADFRAVMEEASGQDLEPFFDQWLYRGGVPRLSGTWAWDPAARAVTVDLRQTQAGEPFHLSVDVALQGPGSAARIERVEMPSGTASATFKADAEPTTVVLDPGVTLLAATEIVARMEAPASAVLPGIETFLADVPQALRGKRVGLITNHTGVDRFKTSDIDLIARHKDLKLVALLAPEHGIRGTLEAGDPVKDEIDAKTGVPVYSLYLSEDRGPTKEMLKNVDVLIYDLQEVGGRTWTYVSTMALSMEAARRKGIPFVVLDRPNPIGGEIVEGALLDPKFKSFVGMYPIPARHGMTVGELAKLFNEKYGIGADLIVAKVANWKRSQWQDQTGLPWVNPSPNLRSLAALTSYPGSVYFEGTTLSEGRGTDRPFEQIGAPWLRAEEVARVMNARRLPGVEFEAITMSILPTAAKHTGLTVPAIRFRVTDRKAYRPVRTSLLLIDEIRRRHLADFEWTATIDRLTGSDKVRLAIEAGRLAPLLEEWDREAAAFRESRKAYLLY